MKSILVLLKLFRALFPSWRFFDRVETYSLLFVRFSENETELKEWTKILTPPKRSLINLFFNPEGNYFLAANSLVTQCLEDINELNEEGIKNIELQPGYCMLKNLVEYELKKLGKIKYYQFKVKDFAAGVENTALEDRLVSKVFQLV